MAHVWQGDAHDDPTGSRRQHPDPWRPNPAADLAPLLPARLLRLDAWGQDRRAKPRHAEVTPVIRDAARQNPHINVELQAIKFANRAEWHIGPAPVPSTKWSGRT